MVQSANGQQNDNIKLNIIQNDEQSTKLPSFVPFCSLYCFSSWEWRLKVLVASTSLIRKSRYRSVHNWLLTNHTSPFIYLSPPTHECVNEGGNDVYDTDGLLKVVLRSSCRLERRGCFENPEVRQQGPTLGSRSSAHRRISMWLATAVLWPERFWASDKQGSIHVVHRMFGGLHRELLTLWLQPLPTFFQIARLLFLKGLHTLLHF